jgi:uncharacterized protein YlzI (FlbEa/FlbD family)
MWTVVLVVTGSVVASFAPSDGPMDKVFSIIEGFTYDDTEMKTQLDLQRKRLKTLILENDSLSNLVITQTTYCTDQLIQKNREYNNKILSIQQALDDLEREEQLKRLNRKPSVKIVQTKNEKVNVKYDTLVNQTITERSGPQQVYLALDGVENSIKPKTDKWYNRLLGRKSNKEVSQINTPPSTTIQLINSDTIITPVLTREEFVRYDTLRLEDNIDMLPSKSYGRLRKLIKGNNKK